jgi:probable F420-dependent oxidoreductase
MHLAITLSHLEHLSAVSHASLLGIARDVDKSGASQIVLSEHVVLPHGRITHRGAIFAHAPDAEYPDPLVSLGAIAAVTRNVRLSTNLLIAPLRPPVLLAKMAATVDVLSGGRLDLGLGVGWNEQEFAALGVPMDRRGARLEACIKACKALWTNAPSTFHSDFVSFTDMYCSPMPLQIGGIPIWLGGDVGHRMARRVAEMGDGWSPIGGTTPEEVGLGTRLIKEACESIERNAREIAIRVTIPIGRDISGRPALAATLAHAEPYVDAGATFLQLPPLHNFLTAPDQVSPFVREAVAALGTMYGSAPM